VGTKGPDQTRIFPVREERPVLRMVRTIELLQLRAMTGHSILVEEHGTSTKIVLSIRDAALPVSRGRIAFRHGGVRHQ
jgi:hypothetical protein